MQAADRGSQNVYERELRLWQDRAAGLSNRWSGGWRQYSLMAAGQDGVRVSLKEEIKDPTKRRYSTTTLVPTQQTTE